MTTDMTNKDWPNSLNTFPNKTHQDKTTDKEPNRAPRKTSQDTRANLNRPRHKIPIKGMSSCLATLATGANKNK
jgi:hypothetical protein